MKTLRMRMLVFGMILGTVGFGQGERTDVLLEMRDELGLTPFQVAELKKVDAEWDRKRESTVKNMSLPKEEKKDVLIKSREEVRRKIEEILTERQRERAGDILKDRYPRRDDRVEFPRRPYPSGSENESRKDEKCCCCTHKGKGKRPHPVFREHPGDRAQRGEHPVIGNHRR